MEGFASLRSLLTGPVRPASRAFAVAGYHPYPHHVDGAGRRTWRRHGGGPMRGGAMADLPLIKAAKLWAKISQRTGATYLTGRWGGCRVLVFENLERASEAEPSHFLFLGEAGEWPHPEQATTPVGGRGVDTGSPRATGRSCRCDRGRGGGEARPAAPEGARGQGIQTAPAGAGGGRGRSPSSGAGRCTGTRHPSCLGRCGSGARAGAVRSTAGRGTALPHPWRPRTGRSSRTCSTTSGGDEAEGQA